MSAECNRCWVGLELLPNTYCAERRASGFVSPHYYNLTAQDPQVRVEKIKGHRKCRRAVVPQGVDREHKRRTLPEDAVRACLVHQETYLSFKQVRLQRPSSLLKSTIRGIKP